MARRFDWTPFARGRWDAPKRFVVARMATMLMTLTIGACTGKHDRELGELLPRSALLHDALGCYTIEPAADLRPRWSAMLDSMHIASMASIVVDSSIFVSESRGARILEVDRSDTQPAIDIWRADSLSASIRWYFYRVRHSMVIDLEPVDGDHYAGDVWWWSDALPAPERIGSVRARRVPCVPKRP